MEFTPITVAPSKNDKWYIRKDYGGYSPCIAGKPNYRGDQSSALSNCVGYVWGRIASLKGDRQCRIGFTQATRWPVNAQSWYANAPAVGFQIGKVPKLGAVACWRTSDNKSGHVAVVEKILDNGCIVVSESCYKGYTWRLSTLGKSYYKRGLIFQGFIYTGDWEEKKDDVLKVGDKVKIIGKGNGQANGNGRTAGGIGLTRYIYKIYNGSPYPYRVGYMSGITTGFYKADALRKI